MRLSAPKFTVMMLLLHSFWGMAQTESGETLTEDWGEFLAKMWRFEIIRLEGSPLTVSKLVTGLLVLVCSIWFARFFINRLHRFFRRIGMNPSTAVATKTLLFYGLLIIAIMVTLEVIQIPLTVFTLMGGAVAIGVGFGSQNLLNNFISGLILLAERTIRVGDLIQIDDLHGTVTNVGGRSTMVRTGNNVDIIIPNSTFLEQNVVNLTLGDDRIRTSVIVGVAYGSPLERVEALLEEAAKAHPNIIPDPKPIVLFSDFGDSALTFEIHFWIRIKSLMDRHKAQSKMRYIIDEIFRTEHIVIAFPQRDLHLHTHTPLDIRLNGQPESRDKPNTNKPGDIQPTNS